MASKNKMLAAALAYARAGYRVLILHGVDPKSKRCTCAKGSKCGTAGKHPRLPQWTKSATRDEATIKRWFGKYPDANVGLMPPDGCIVVDVDPRNGGDASALGLPANTPKQITGGGGTHYVVRVAPGTKLPTVKGIDFLHPGKHQFVAEPSVHASGGHYGWLDILGQGFDIPPALWNPPALEPEALAPIPVAAPNTRTHIQSLEVAESMLASMPDDMFEYGRWVDVGQALKHVFSDDAFPLWDVWSQRDPQDRYTESVIAEKWDTFDQNRDRPLVSWGSLVYHALRGGWRLPAELAPDAADLWAARAAPPLAPSHLPADLYRWAMAHAAVSGFDPAGYALAAVVAIAAAVHRKIQVQPIAANATFIQPPLLWGVMVGTSGTGKSSILDQAVNAHILRDAELMDEYREARRAWDETPKEDRTGTEPKRGFVAVRDTTQEKLEEKLATSPHNVLAIHDELRTFFDAMQRYTKGTTRGAALAMWNGRPHSVERIGRGELYIEYFGACVIGTTQTETFTRWFAVESGDGMLPRFLPVVVRGRFARAHEAGGEFAQGAEALDAAHDLYRRAIHRLFGFAPQQETVLTFEASAQALYSEQRTRWDARAADLAANVGENYVSTLLSKAAGHAARVALALHMWAWATSARPAAQPPTRIATATVAHALAFIDLSISHAEVLHDGQPQAARHIKLAHAVADYTLARCEGHAEIESRELTQNLKPWRSNPALRPSEHEGDQRAAIRFLIEMNWLLADTSRRARASGDGTRWLINPRVFAQFRARQASAKAHRDAINEQWQAAKAAKREGQP